MYQALAFSSFAYVFLFARPLLCSDQKFRHFFQSDRENHISAATSVLVDKFVQFTIDNMVVSTDAARPETANIQNDIITKVLVKSGGSRPFCVHDSRSLDAKYPRIYNLLVVDGFESFYNIYSQLDPAVHPPLGFYVVVVSVLLPNTLKTVKQIFQQFWSFFVVNVVILTRYVDDNVIQMYTYFPFTRTHCRKIVPVLFDTFRNGEFQRKIPVFPLKLINFFGCPLNVSIFHYMPFLNLTHLENGTISVGGIDGTLLRVLGETLNFTTAFQVSFDVPASGVVYFNGSATGAFGMVKEGNCDFTIGGLGYTYTRALYLSASVPYIDDYMIFASPMPSSYTSLERLLFPFELSVWIAIVATFLLGVVVITVLKLLGKDYIEFVSGPKNRYSTFQMLNVTFGGSLASTPRRNFARTMLFMWITLTTILRNSYQGSLYTYLKSQDAKVLYKSGNELIAMGYKVYIQSHWPAIIHLMNLSDDQYVMMDDDFHKYLELMYTPGFKGIATVANSDLMYFNMLHRTMPTVKPLRDQLFYFPSSMFFKKNSHLVRPFNRNLLNFMGSGLIRLWRRKFLTRPYRQHKPEQPKKKGLSLSDLSGSFQICWMCTGVAILVFLLELSVKVSSVTRKMLDFYTH